MNLILDYDQSCDSAPQAFFNALGRVAADFDATFTSSATVTIDVGYGEVDGQPFANNAILGESNTTFISEPDAASPNGQVELTPAQAEAMQLIGTQPICGEVGFSTLNWFHYDGATKPDAGQYDFIGVAEHEITEVMGRQLLLGDPGYTALDLLRYSAPGVHDYSPIFGGYASANGGATILNGFNVNTYGDPGDWQGATNDAFNAFTNPGVRNPMSKNDLAVMNAIGWTNGGVIEATHVHHHI